MKKTIAVLAISFLFAQAGFAAQHEMSAGDKAAGDKPAATQAPKAASKAKKCPKGKVYSKKDKKCIAKAHKGTTPAAPATPATPAEPSTGKAQ